MKMIDRRQFMKGSALAVALGALHLAPVPAFADSWDGSLEDSSGLDPALFEEANRQLVQRGEKAIAAARNARRAGSYVTPAPTHYYQEDSRWSGDIMQDEGLPIGTHGCCLTSFAMVQTFFGGTDTPTEVNQKMGTNACPFEFTYVPTVYGYTIKNYHRGTVTNTYAANFVVGAIDSNLPAIVGMVPSVGNTHFVTAYGYTVVNGVTTIIIYDPARSRNYTNLTQYLNSGYSVNRLYVYKV